MPLKSILSWKLHYEKPELLEISLLAEVAEGDAFSEPNGPAGAGQGPDNSSSTQGDPWNTPTLGGNR